MGLFSSSDIGVDLGTAYSLIYVRGKGIVLRQPSVVAVERGSGKMTALGEKAKEMLQSDYGTLSDIAAGVGYSSVFHFSKMFKGVTGISPGSYAKQK